MGTVALSLVGGILGALGVLLWRDYRAYRASAPTPSQPTHADVDAFIGAPEQRIREEIPEIETRLAKHPKFKDLPSADRHAAAEELAQKAAMHLGKFRRGI